jgi:hypothetical protein
MELTSRIASLGDPVQRSFVAEKTIHLFGMVRRQVPIIPAQVQVADVQMARQHLQDEVLYRVFSLMTGVVIMCPSSLLRGKERFELNLKRP